MASKAQRESQVKVVCQCGCGEEFQPFPIYGSKNTRNHPEEYLQLTGKQGAILYIPRFKRAHNPRIRKGLQGPAWNKGLTKEVCPTLSRMGFQPGHKPYNDWSHVIEKQRNDEEYRKRWLASKKGQVPWNKGKTKDQYRNGIKTGVNHGNWKGGRRGLHDRAEWKRFTKSILKRDHYRCQKCGDHNYKGRGSRCTLDAHHIVAVSDNHDLAFEPSNAITLCRKCHIETDNYGTKLLHRRKKQGGK